MRTLRIVSVAAVLLTSCLAGPAVAQQTVPGVGDHRATFAFGLSQLHEVYGSGWGTDVELSSTRTWSALGLGWVVSGGVNVFDGFSEATGMGGVRFSTRSGATVRPFGQIMAGMEYCGACRTTDPTFEPSAGVDVSIGHEGRFSLRMEVGYRITPSDRRTFKETHVLIGISYGVLVRK